MSHVVWYLDGRIILFNLSLSLSASISLTNWHALNIKLGKVVSMGPASYFGNNWNRFDFSLVALSIMDRFVSGGNLNVSVFRSLRVFRMARLLRVFKLSRAFAHMAHVMDIIAR